MNYKFVTIGNYRYIWKFYVKFEQLKTYNYFYETPATEVVEVKFIKAR